MTLPAVLGTPLSGGSNTSDLYVDIPTGVTPGELLCIAISSRSNGIVTTPIGWTLELTQYGASHWPSFYTKVSDGTEGGTQVVFSDTKSNRKAWVAIRTDATGVDDAAISLEVFDPDVVHAQVITTKPDAMLLRVFNSTNHDGSVLTEADFTPAGTLIEEFSLNTTSSAYCGIGYDTQAAVGPSTTPTSSCSVSSTLTGMTIALYKDEVTGPNIVNVDTDGNITDGQGIATLDTINFGSDINSITVGDGTYNSINKFLSGTSGSWIWGVDDFLLLGSDTPAGQPNWFTGTLAVEASDGSDTASAGVIWNSQADTDIVTIVDGEDKVGSIFSGRSEIPPDGSVIYYSNLGNTLVSDSGIISTDLEEVSGVLWDLGTGVIEKWLWTTDAPLPPGGGGTVTLAKTIVSSPITSPVTSPITEVLTKLTSRTI